MKIALTLGMIAVYVAALLLVYTIHARYFAVDVVLFSAIGDAVLAAIICLVVLVAVTRRFPIFTGLEKTLVVTTWLLVGYVFAISVPTVLDRSLSFYILEKLNQRGGGIQLSRFPDVFTKEYIEEFRLVEVRLTEQVEAGTVVIDNGCVRLTQWGRSLSSISRYLRTSWLPRQRLLGETYNSELTKALEEKAPRDLKYEC